MLYASVTYAKALCLIGVFPLLLGLPLYALSELKFPGAALGVYFKTIRRRLGLQHNLEV